MLKKCPECELNVSDKAMACPHCGYPFTTNMETQHRKRPIRKRRKLPNGFGQISEIKGQRLAKPFRAMVTVGKNDAGGVIVKPLKPVTYFKTYNEAYEALIEYNKDPYDLTAVITMNDLFEQWLPEHGEKLKNPKSINNLKVAWTYCEAIYDIDVRSIRTRHLAMLFEKPYKTIDGDKVYASPHTIISVKSTLNILCDYAVKRDLMVRNYARETLVETELVTNGHIPFTQEELDILWKNVDSDRSIRMILLNCYMGWRPTEMLEIAIKNVDFDTMVIVGGSKTNAGMNRLVPIHSRVIPIFNWFLEDSREHNSQWLIRNMIYGNKRVSYTGYYNLFNKTIEKYGLNPSHRPHDCRKTFVTLAKAAKVDEYAIKRIIGHAITDITEKIYTERPVSWLKEEIEKIK